MKNDNDDIDDLARELMITDDQASAAGNIARWLPTVVVLGAVAGFIGLAWYAYQTGAQSLKDDELLVVEADATPMKEKPLDPGGMKFPNQDKTIFETFGSNPQMPPKVERVLPSPEEPMPKAMDTSQTTTWVNDKLKNDDAPASGKTEEVIADKKEEVKAEEEKSPIKTAANQNVETYTKVAVESAPALPVDKTASAARVQLGAYRSEEEAQKAWDKIQKQHAALAGKTPLIVKADLGAKGVYYRLRLGVADAEAGKALCGKLSAKGQACIPVKE